MSINFSKYAKAIFSNEEKPILGFSCFGNVDDYSGKSEAELRKYREWQVKAFKIFYESPTFQALNKGLFRC